MVNSSANVGLEPPNIMLSSATVYMYQGRISENGQSPPSLRRDEADGVSTVSVKRR